LRFNLPDGRTAQGNVELGLKIIGLTRAERGRRSLKILDLIGPADNAGAYSSELSGGQKQRVGIARRPS
jgi:ABC-type methionine transport system ATPase subunit